MADADIAAFLIDTKLSLRVSQDSLGGAGEGYGYPCQTLGRIWALGVAPE